MYGYGYPYGFYFDPTYVLLIIGMISGAGSFRKNEKHVCPLSTGTKPQRDLPEPKTAQRILTCCWNL